MSQSFKEFRDAVILLAWMYLIFFLSGQHGEGSGRLSLLLCRFLAGCLQDVAALLSPWIDLALPDLETMARAMQFWVRKAAHATEFGILSMLALRWLHWRISRRGILFISAWLFCLCCAAGDEIHQLFVPGRSGEVRDVCVDVTGGFVALALCWKLGAFRVKKALLR